MKQREVTDKENIKWVCVQAYGLEGKIAEKATELLESSDDKVPVVCTPTGGAKSVRLNLDTKWEDELSEEQLLNAISKAKG